MKYINNVSIIVPFFNASKTIKATLQSIFNQTYQNYECILIDDSSEDNSYSIVQKSIIYDKRFKLLKQSKAGVVAARNFGIKNCHGRYITFLDSDDIWHPDFLMESLMIMEKRKDNIAMTHSSYFRFKLHKNKIISYLIHTPKIITYKNILKKNFMPLLTVLIDREKIKELYFEDKRPEDYRLWINLIYIKRYKSISIRKPLAYYRISDKQRSKNKIFSLLRIYKLYKDLPNTNFLKLNINIFNWIIYNSFQRIIIKKRLDKDELNYLNYLNYLIL